MPTKPSHKKRGGSVIHDAERGTVENTVFRVLDLLQKSIESEEKQAEQRINFFLSLVAASVGILAILIKEKVNFLGDPLLVISGLLMILLAFGAITLNRINWRAINIRKYSALHQYALRQTFLTNPTISKILQAWERLNSMQQSTI